MIAKVDQFVAAMDAAKASTLGFSETSERNLKRIGGQMQSFGRTATLGVTAPIVALGVSSLNMARDYEQSFSRMVGLAEVPAAEVGRLKEAVLGLAGETGQAPADLARGLYQAASSGLDASQALVATEYGAKAAALGMGAAKDVTGLLAAATAAYGEENITAAETMDMLTMAIREGRAEPDEMAHALGRVLPIASQMGITFDQVAGAVAYLSNIMGDTDITVTAFRDALVKLNNPTAKGRKALKEMGTSFGELKAAISSGGLLGALDLLREHGFAANGEALADLFADVQGFQAATALLNDESGALAVTLGKTAQATGAFEEAWQGWLGTDAAKITQSIGKMKVAMMEMGNVLLPIAADVMGFAGDVAGVFADLPEPVQQAMVAILGLAAAAGPISLFAGTVVKNLGEVSAAMFAMQATAATTRTVLLGALGWAGLGLGGAMLGKDLVDSGKLEFMGIEEGDFERGVDVLHRWATMRDLRQRIGSAFSGPELQGSIEFLPEDPMKGVPPPSALYGPKPGQMGPYQASTLELGEAARAYRAAGEAAGVYNGQLLIGDEWTDAMAASNARLTANLDHYGSQIDGIIVKQRQQYEAYKASEEGARNFGNVIASADWGAAGLEGANTALGKFSSGIFDGHHRVAAMEQSMDGLSDALKKVSTVGAGGLDDLNLKTAEGRAAFGALREVASAWEPELAEAVDMADGNVDVLSSSIEGIRADFIAMAVDAGIGKTEAAALADAIGLVPESAPVLIELSGVEEAKLKLDLLKGSIDGLPDDVETRVNQLIIQGDYVGALEVVDSYYADNPVAIQAIADAAAANTDLDAAAQERTAQIIAQALTSDAASGLDTTAQQRVADIIANAVTQAADEGLDGTAAQERIADIVAWAITADADGDLNLTARQRDAIIQAIGSGIVGVDSALNSAARDRTTTIRVRYTNPGVPQAFAAGGTVGPEGGIAGEAGPELLQLGGRSKWIDTPHWVTEGTVVTPLDKMSAGRLTPALGLGGGGSGSSSVTNTSNVHVHFHGNVYDRPGVEQIVEQSWREKERRALAGSRI